jgi:hypothetical protein
LSSLTLFFCVSVSENVNFTNSYLKHGLGTWW